MPAQLLMAAAALLARSYVERIVDALDGLNDRQLEALGLARECLWSFAEACVDRARSPRPDALAILDEPEGPLALPRAA